MAVAGAAFDKGETWSGLGEHLASVALPAVAEIKAAYTGALEREELPTGATMAQAALRWILDHEGVSCVIPGARTIEQVAGNLGACDLPPLSKKLHAQVHATYEAQVKPIIEAERW